MAKKGKKYNPLKACKSRLKGIVLEWTDKGPGSGISDGISKVKYSHSNPVYRVNAKNIAKVMHAQISRTLPMLWLLDFTTIFGYGSGEDQHCSRIEFFGVLDDMEEDIRLNINIDRKKGDESKYRHVAFRVECLGSVKPKSVEDEIRDLLALTG